MNNDKIHDVKSGTFTRSGLAPGTLFFCEKDGSRLMCRSLDGDPNVLITSGSSEVYMVILSTLLVATLVTLFRNVR